VKKIKLKTIWPFLPALAIIAFVVLISQLNIFNIRKISCLLDTHPCSLELEPFLVNLYGSNIFTFDKKRLNNQLTQYDPTLADITINKKLPNSLVVNIKKRIPIAKVISTLDLEFASLNSTKSATISGMVTDQFFHLDKSGEFFSSLNLVDLSLPTILVSDHHQIINGSSNLSNNLVKLITALKTHYVSFLKIAWLPTDQIIIQTQLGPYAVLNSDQPLNSAVASLQYILTNIKIGQELPTKIDLRFDKPVLTY